MGQKTTEASADSNDYSLNRCTDNNLPYQYTSFKLGSPTPGSRNDCTGPRYIISEDIQNRFPILDHEPMLSYDPFELAAERTLRGQEESCSIRTEGSVSPQEYYNLMTSEVHQGIADAHTATGTADMPPDAAELSATFEIIGGRKQRIIDEALQDVPSAKKARLASMAQLPEWESTAHFQESWLTFIQERIPQSKFKRKWIDDNPDWKKWLEIRPNTESPLDTEFRCRICNKHFDRLMSTGAAMVPALK